ACGASPPGENEKPSDLVVHEWGTFLSMSGSDGVSLDGMYHEEHALPGFVHARARDQLRWRSILTKSETPVIYFYTDREQRASVEVKFPQGIWTQWYPQAEFVLPRLASLPYPIGAGPRDGRIFWNVLIKPAGTKGPIPAPPLAASDSLWNFAREVDSAYVLTSGSPGSNASAESERYLFYRGLGTAPLPLKMTAANRGTITLEVGAPTVAHIFVIEVKEGRGRFQYYPSLAPGQTLSAVIPSGPMLDDSTFLRSVSDALADRLVQSGLFPKEARAMVNTWKSSYFGTDGVRVLFVLPQSWTDAVIPLRIQPTPRSITRVMVGRMELLLPERERLAEQAVRDLASPDPAKRYGAFRTLEEQGRYVEPIVRRLLTTAKDPQVQALCKRLLASEYVTELRAAVRSRVATQPAPPLMAANEDSVLIRARLASLLREVGLDEEARAEGGAALAALRARPRPGIADITCENRHGLRALGLASEAVGDDHEAAARFGELVELGRFATRRQDCRDCHRQAGAALASGLRDWWAGEAYSRAVQRRDDSTRRPQDGTTHRNTPTRDSALVRLAYLYRTLGRNLDAELAWTAIGEPKSTLAQVDDRSDLQVLTRPIGREAVHS
ncbi:MAG: hypothetical protein U0794_08315, partial [Isosphaeraceae bacterium]